MSTTVNGSAKKQTKIKTDIITLTRFILEQQQKVAPDATGELTLLLNSLQFAFKFIASTIRQAELIHLKGLYGETNSSGDSQKKLDVIGDEIFINAMRASDKVKVLVSEEQEDLLIFEQNHGNYAVCCDPIDGSSNLDAGVSVGTIFSIFKLLPGSKGSIKDVLRCGNDLVAAGYTMYGASAHLVLTTGYGVNGFTLDTQLGEFILTEPDLKLPEYGHIYAINEGYFAYWPKKVQDYIVSLKQPQPEDNKPYKLRYIGAMVADIHRTLLYGGLFGYPADSHAKSGKLRILYECFPMAWLMEQAGGMAVDEDGNRILDKTPKRIHERSGIWLGSKGEVEKILKYIKQ